MGRADISTAQATQAAPATDAVTFVGTSREPGKTVLCAVERIGQGEGATVTVTVNGERLDYRLDYVLTIKRRGVKWWSRHEHMWWSYTHQAFVIR